MASLHSVRFQQHLVTHVFPETGNAKHRHINHLAFPFPTFPYFLETRNLLKTFTFPDFRNVPPKGGKRLETLLPDRSKEVPPAQA
jgi:hypothetical protein